MKGVKGALGDINNTTITIPGTLMRPEIDFEDQGEKK